MLDSILQFLESLPPVAALVAGIALLIGGGGALVEGAIHIARRFGVSTLLIGLTIVAFGTSAPELAFNIIAAANGNGELSFGNVIGSNIANIGLVLGLAAIASPLVVHGRVVRRELPLLIGATVLTMVLAGVGQGFDRRGGLILLAGFAICMWLWFRLGRQDRKDPLAVEASEAAGDGVRPPLLAALLFLLGLVGLLLGGKLAEIGAVGIATSLGLSKTLIGLTVVAVATSLPEVVTSLLASRRGHNDLAVGNVVGSNLFNLLLVLGSTSVIAKVPLPAENFPFGLASGWWDLSVMLAMTILLLPFAISHDRRILKWEGLLLLLGYAGWLAWGVLRELCG